MKARPAYTFQEDLQNRLKDPEFKKEYETLKRKHSIPNGEKLEKMLATEEGKKRYEARSKNVTSNAED